MSKVYFIGIGGAGTAALAAIYSARGFNVSGVDDGDGFYTNSLEEKNIEVFKEFDASHITGDIDFVVHTTAINDNNVELQKARELGLDIMTYPEAVGKMTQESKTIAVCGTHGKTTTTALTAHSLIVADIDPTVIVGSKVPSWNSGAYVGGGEYFLIEADEYQNKLALYKPFSIILTSVDFDHPDFFEDFDNYKRVFSDFVTRISESGFLVANGDDDDVRDVAVAAKCQVFFYGESDLNNCHIVNRETNESGQVVTVKFRDEEYKIKTQLLGEHNAKNAVAAWLMSFIITNNAQKSAEGIEQCTGTTRRFESRGTLRGAHLIDDYAHHPKEIEATLSTVKEVFKDKKIIAAFHPHTFSRTEALLDEFAESLSAADEVIVLDIFTSPRETSGNITAKDLVDKIELEKKQNIHTIDELATWMNENLTENDVFITLGAGDIWKVYERLKSSID